MARSTLGVSLGSRTTGIAVIKDQALVEASSLTLRNKDISIHTPKLEGYIRQYAIDTVVVKTPPVTHLSERLNSLLHQFVHFFTYHGCMVEYKDIKAAKQSLPDIENKNEAVAHVAQRYPRLMPILAREQNNKQKYHIKMLEAVIIAHIKHTERN